jgi:hypothetical protein
MNGKLLGMDKIPRRGEGISHENIPTTQVLISKF